MLNLQRQLAHLKLLIIDELGFVPLSTTGAELLFEVFSQRYERGSILVTTNLPFDEWTPGLRPRTPHRRPAGSSHPPRPHHRDERRQLPAQRQPAKRCIISSRRIGRRLARSRFQIPSAGRSGKSQTMSSQSKLPRWYGFPPPQCRRSGKMSG